MVMVTQFCAMDPLTVLLYFCRCHFDLLWCLWGSPDSLTYRCGDISFFGPWWWQTMLFRRG